MTVVSTPPGVLLGRLDELVRWARTRSIFPLNFGLACCAVEWMATGAAHNDLDRFGMLAVRASRGRQI